jgi:hypothetical protein
MLSSYDQQSNTAGSIVSNNDNKRLYTEYMKTTMQNEQYMNNSA